MNVHIQLLLAILNVITSHHSAVLRAGLSRLVVPKMPQDPRVPISTKLSSFVPAEYHLLLTILFRSGYIHGEAYLPDPLPVPVNGII